jgi:hypothetical protein
MQTERADDNKENKGARSLEGQSHGIKMRLVETAFELIIESLKAKNQPDEVNYRSLEKTKITNFLRK